MAQLSSVFADSSDNLWSRLMRDGRESLMDQLRVAAEEGRVYDLMQLSLKALAGDNHNLYVQDLPDVINTACSNFDRLNKGVQHNDDITLTETFAVACYRGQLDDVRRLSHVVRDDVDMLGVGLHFALLQRRSSRKKEHWDTIKWLMDNTQLRDNPLVLRRAFMEACEHNESKEVRWMLQYRQLAQHTRTINKAIWNACFFGHMQHVSIFKCVVEHTDVDVNKIQRKGTLLHYVLWMNREVQLHTVCREEDSDESDVYRLVCKCGFNVNEQDNDGNTPLHVACSRYRRDSQRTDIIEALIILGADVNITNDANQTPAQEAVLYGHNELLPLLDSTSLMDIIYKRRQRREQLNVLRNCISVHLTALLVGLQSCRY
jgi:hypothetical protein